MATAHADEKSFLAGILRADHRTVARAISEVENETAIGHAIMRGIHPHLGRAHVLGITGSPGAGKSTLASELIGEFTRRGRSVGVVAVDPSSPFSGGAILGDRIRMERHALAERVFIRSLASRGHLGGLSRAIFRVVDVLDAAGFAMIVVETVGAGQSEVEIAEIADTRVVVCAPGFGDDVQAIKAGILEIADIFVVSKCDLPLADATELELRYLAGLKKGGAGAPPILRVTATRGEGIAALADAIESAGGAAGRRRQQGARERMRRLIAQEAGNAVRDCLCGIESKTLDELCAALARGELGHEEAVAAAIQLAVNGGAGSPRGKDKSS
ncbi:MAG: methylmalonyl Co-A mutase-associated GTPase MeaB [Betaproteobacteria bacterium]|nr:methylmalonyl Co-A mutase-associated GTPase MeaB [Betaproteobacteria bacterium]